MSADDKERTLDTSLRAGTSPDDPEVAELVSVGRKLQKSFEVDAPRAAHERAMFVEGAAAVRRRSFFAGLIAPALTAAVVLVGAAILARGAAPGEGLYPVKRALRTVGLAPSPSDDINELIGSARDLVDEAAAEIPANPSAAEALALEAVGDLEAAQELLPELAAAERAAPARAIENLEERAAGIIFRAGAERRGIRPTPSPTPTSDDSERDDSSGPGSGDDDSSGPGSGDEDSSGPGSGDDDSSGPGSGDDDSSGPGSGDDDSSGSGSGSGDDSSGSGSGGDSSGPSATSGSGGSSGSEGDSGGSGSG